MRIVQCSGNLLHDTDHFGGIGPSGAPFPPDPPGQVLSLDIFHDEEIGTILVTFQKIHACDVRMFQSVHKPEILADVFHQIGIVRQFGRDQLQSIFNPGYPFQALEHHPHRAGPEPFLEQITPQHDIPDLKFPAGLPFSRHFFHIPYVSVF